MGRNRNSKENFTEGWKAKKRRKIAEKRSSLDSKLKVDLWKWGSKPTRKEKWRLGAESMNLKELKLVNYCPLLKGKNFQGDKNINEKNILQPVQDS